MDLRQTYGLIYGAVAIHSVQTRGKLLARFNGSREDAEWAARGLMYGIPCFRFEASWCGNGVVLVGKRLCWVRRGIAFFSSTSSSLAKVSMRLRRQKVPSMHSENNLPCSHAFQWMHLLGFYQLHKLGRSMTKIWTATMHSCISLARPCFVWGWWAQGNHAQLGGALSAKWLQLKHSGVGRDLPLVRQLPGTRNILVPKNNNQIWFWSFEFGNHIPVP